MIKLVVGLGNPGKEYERTRHNAGFWLVERLAQSKGVVLRKDPKFKALVGKTAEGAWLLLPQSFMNLSGQPVQMLAGFFKIKPEEVLDVHDELDFPPGSRAPTTCSRSPRPVSATRSMVPSRRRLPSCRRSLPAICKPR